MNGLRERSPRRRSLPPPAARNASGPSGNRHAGRDERQAQPATVRTRATLARTLGRIALWLVLAVIGIRGMAAIAAGPQRPERPVIAAAAGAGWPDESARAFAADFARAYLTWSPQHPGYHQLAVKPFVSDSVPDDAGLQVPDHGSNQTVNQVIPADGKRIGGDRALITVAATVSNRTITTRYLTVPVARDAHGGLAVYDLPSFAPPPAPAAAGGEDSQSLDGREGAEISDVLQRFLTAYLGGRTADLAYFLPPGDHLQALAQHYELSELQNVTQVTDAGGAKRTVLAVATVRDPESGARFDLRFRIELAHRDRWYVQRIDR